MPYVSSSAMDRVEWSGGTLSIWFRGSGRYDYYCVPEHIYHGLLHASSKGADFNDHIRDRYGCYSQCTITRLVAQSVSGIHIGGPAA
jgi:hypothetical protein